MLEAQRRVRESHGHMRTKFGETKKRDCKSRAWVRLQGFLQRMEIEAEKRQRVSSTRCPGHMPTAMTQFKACALWIRSLSSSPFFDDGALLRKARKPRAGGRFASCPLRAARRSARETLVPLVLLAIMPGAGALAQPEPPGRLVGTKSEGTGVDEWSGWSADARQCIDWRMTCKDGSMSSGCTDELLGPLPAADTSFEFERNVLVLPTQAFAGPVAEPSQGPSRARVTPSRHVARRSSLLRSAATMRWSESRVALSQGRCRTVGCSRPRSASTSS
jgi:hypothetical protein